MGIVVAGAGAAGGRKGFLAGEAIFCLLLEKKSVIIVLLKDYAIIL